MALVSIVTDRAQHLAGATGPDGRFDGSFCVVDREPRIWTEADRQAMVDLADFVRAELLLRDHLDRTEQAQHARDDLVKTLAHDLRAAVMVVVGALQTLDAHPDADPGRRQQVTEVALRQSHRIQDMMERLLDTPTAAGLPLADTNLREVTDAAVAAACAAFDGDERVEIDVEPIAVSDHGPGLPEWLLTDDLGDASLRGRSTGHGIGLFSALTLARSLGGDITVQTGTTGTTLLLTLPATGPPTG